MVGGGGGEEVGLEEGEAGKSDYEILNNFSKL